MHRSDSLRRWSHWLFPTRAVFYAGTTHHPPTGSGNTSGGGCGAGAADPYRQFSDILSSRSPHGAADIFDGKFMGGSGVIDPSAIAQMQRMLQANITPEMRDSMAKMMRSNLQGDGGGGDASMGMMAFGLGENEKGKKVARAAKLSYDLKTGKVSKDFMEQQLDPDDVSLPKDTVGNYDTDGAVEVEFVEATQELHGKSVSRPTESIAEAEVVIETAPREK